MPSVSTSLREELPQGLPQPRRAMSERAERRVFRMSHRVTVEMTVAVDRSGIRSRVDTAPAATATARTGRRAPRRPPSTRWRPAGAAQEPRSAGSRTHPRTTTARARGRMSIRGLCVSQRPPPNRTIRPQPWTCGGLRPYPADRLAGNRIILFSRNLEFEGDDYGKPYECASPGGGLVCAAGDLSVRTVHADSILTYFNQAAFLSSVPIASTETFDEFQPIATSRGYRNLGRVN